MKPILAALAALGLAAATAARADSLLDNVNGITFGAEGEVVRFTGLQIGSGGRVVRLLGPEDERPVGVDHRIDGKGRVALPGLIDSHSALIDFGLAAMVVDLTGTNSLHEVLLKIGAFAAERPEQSWIVGTGWNHEDWDRPELPEAVDLDAVVSDRPVWLISADGRTGWANSLALQAAGVTGETLDPEGGTIVRRMMRAQPPAEIAEPDTADAGDAEPRVKQQATSNPAAVELAQPTGVLIGTARSLVDQAIPAPRPVERDLALARAQQLLAERGVTAVADVGTRIEDWQTFRRAGDRDRLTLRIMAYAEGVEAAELIGGPGPTPWLYDDRLRLNGVVLRLDGPLASRAALLKAPYADDTATSGSTLLGDARLEDLMRRAAAGGFQVAIDAHGDAAVAGVLDGIEALPGSHDRRWRIEGGSVIDPADVQRAGRARVALSAMPRQLPAEYMLAESRLGVERLAGAFAWKSLADAGAVLAFASAAPARAPAPFSDMAAAITRAGANGEPYGGWQPDERLSREAALAAYTSGGAWAGLADGRFGRLAPGEHADFILIDGDPLLATPDELRAMRVIETWIGGRKVYQAPELPLEIPRRPDDQP